MKDFIVLCKPLLFQHLDSKSISIDTVQLSFLMQQAYKDHPVARDYDIDKDSIRFEQVEGKLCVILLAYRK